MHFVNLKFTRIQIKYKMNILPYLITLLKYVIYGSTVFFTGELTKTTDTPDILALRFLLAFAVMWPLKASGALKIHIGLRDKETFCYAKANL